jgi:diaminopimelate decarboxylase/aspartate kinase
VIADNVNSNSDIRKAHSMLDHFDHKIYITQNSANNMSLSFVVEKTVGEKLLTFLHRELIERNKKHIDNVDTWWSKNIPELMKLYESQQLPSLYVYSLDKVNEQVSKLELLTSVDKFYYAMKANYNLNILKELSRSGFGMEVVSVGELEYVNNVLGTVDTLFTPNFCDANDYTIGFNTKNCHVTVDNIDVIQNNPKIFENKVFCLRLDCGIGGGHHHKVNTEGKQAKFGIPIDQLEEVVKLSKRYNFKIVGLQSHKGSGILDHTAWNKTANVMLKYIKDLDLPNLEYLDLGGGLGVWTDGTQLDLGKMDKSLIEVKKEIQKYYPEIKFHLEPGRFMVAEAGVILAKVNHIKQKEDTKFVGLSIGMNGLIRPALYNSYHPIHNISNFNPKNKTDICDIVGPICETSDVFVRKHRIEKTSIGDIILIDITGAYGRTMSSNYNMIPIPKEVSIKVKELTYFNKQCEE